MEFIETPEETKLAPNTTITDLLQRTSMNDGSIDNIIDKANCFKMKFPVDVEINNGMAVKVDSQEKYNTIETVFDSFDEDDDVVNIIYPVTIILNDFSEVTVNNTSELNSYSNNCHGENEVDDDIECIDFQYPITAKLFNNNNEFLDTVSITNDAQLYNFISTLDDSDIVTIDFPVVVILSDGSQSSINTISNLEMAISNAIDTCDEDDDYNYNDDDCNDCTVEQLRECLLNCSDWTVNNLDRNTNTEDYYVGYKFNFMANGTMTAINPNWNYSGTWEASGTDNNIIVAINIPSLPDCNNNWILHEIKQDSEYTEFDLNLGNHKLRYESGCSTSAVNDTLLVQTLTDGNWRVNYYFNDNDETLVFNDYTFRFFNNGQISITSSSDTNSGNWNTTTGNDFELELNLNFGYVYMLREITEDWDVVEITSNSISLRDISRADGTEDLLTFEKI
ncbi:hypothetical protein GCM10023311_27820 [Flaviramulus aquimarinus]|uniref:Uncharacterized protein n=2 Tax=Flaviramulus aquimarinus TaxID=1170456 RepID=A0ABP9FNR9_9FLAO